MRPKIVSLIAFYHPLIALDGIVALAVLRPVNIGHQATAILAWVSRLAWGYIPFLRGGRAVFLMWMLLSLLASCGLWFLKPWGRILSIILGISWILASIPYFVMGAAFPESYPFDFSSTMRHALQLAVGTLIVIYLCLPKTKLSFHQQNSTAATSRS